MSKSVFETNDISEQKLGNIEVITHLPSVPEKQAPVKYAIPPELDVIGVNAPKYDCCVQKVIDEMGKYISDYKLQFVLGTDLSPGDIIPYFPKYVLFFRSGTAPNTPDGNIAVLQAFQTYYRSLGMKLFYYLDDFLVMMNNRAPIKLMMGCDGVIVSTTALKALLMDEGVSVPIHVLKTHMDITTFDMLPPLEGIRSPDHLNIFFSSQGRIGIQIFHEICQKLDADPALAKSIHMIALSHEVAQVRSIINNCRNLKKTYLEWLPLDLYYRLAQSVDLILAPAQVGDLDYMLAREAQAPWLECKSAHKYTLAGAARVPCIASPIQDYKEAIVQGKTGFIATTIDDWVTCISALKNYPESRETIGAAARADVVENWNIYKRIEELVSIIKDSPAQEEEESHGPSVIIKKQPRVMTYIPVHNGMKYIKECLDSVVSQSYPNQEIVLSDNASTDGTVEFVKENYPQIKLIQLPTYIQIGNPGINQAIRESDCEYWTQIGHDDTLVPNYWETLLPYFSSPKIGLVRVGCYQFSAKNPEGAWWRPAPWTSPIDILVSNKAFITSPSSKAAFIDVGGTDIECFFGDWDMWIKEILAGWKWATCKKPMFRYRRHPRAWSYNYDARQEGDAYTYMRKKWMSHLIQYGIASSTMASSVMIEAAKKEKEAGVCKP